MAAEGLPWTRDAFIKHVFEFQPAPEEWDEDVVPPPLRDWSAGGP